MAILELGLNSSELFENPKFVLSDAKMLRGAINNGWDIPGKMKKEIIEKLSAILQSTDNPRVVNSITVTLAKIDALNLGR